METRSTREPMESREPREPRGPRESREPRESRVSCAPICWVSCPNLCPNFWGGLPQFVPQFLGWFAPICAPIFGVLCPNLGDMALPQFVQHPVAPIRRPSRRPNTSAIRSPQNVGHPVAPTRRPNRSVAPICVFLKDLLFRQKTNLCKILWHRPGHTLGQATPKIGAQIWARRPTNWGTRRPRLPWTPWAPRALWAPWAPLVIWVPPVSAKMVNVF